MARRPSSLEYSFENCLMDFSSSEDRGEPPCMALFPSTGLTKNSSTPRREMLEYPSSSSCSNPDLDQAMSAEVSPQPLELLGCDSGVGVHSESQQHLLAVQEQEQEFYETLHQEEALESRRKELLLRTAPAKLGELKRVLKFDDEEGNEEVSSCASAEEASGTPTRSPAESALLQSVRSEQARMYQQGQAICRLSGSNINRCTPEGRRRLSATPGQTPRLMDERLLNSDRLYKEFDLTDEENTRAVASGSFGFVFTAVNRLDGRVYCLKTAQRAKSRDGPSAQAQAKEGIQEVWAMAGLSERHPNIVEYFGCWVQFDRLYMQLEYCNGLSVHLYLASGRRLRPGRFRQFAKEVGSGLAFMHSEGLAHLDCCPGNILMKAPRCHLPASLPLSERHAALAELLDSDTGRVVFKLGDFGHARDTSDVENLEDGTGKYMPMDAMDLARHPDPRLVDNFSLGLCLLEVAGGHVPSSSDSAEDGEARMRLLETGHVDRPGQMDLVTFRCVLALLRPQPLLRLSIRDLLLTVCPDLLDSHCLAYL